MKIQDILQLEQNNTGIVILHKEGIFYRAYERSAYLFAFNVKQYQITKKYYKNIKQYIVYLGFPTNSLGTILKIVSNKQVSKQDKTIIIKDFDFDKNKFNLWKSTIEIQANTITKKTEIETEILNFPVAHKTPIECQQFLTELQKKLAKH